MKKKKLTGQQIKFMINMLSLAVFLYSYLYLYNGFVDKTDETKDKINQVRQDIADAEKKILREAEVRQNTEDINAQIQAILDSYPVNITKIDNFMFLEQMEEDLDMKFSSINPTDSTPFYDTEIPMRNADGTAVKQSQSDNAGNGAGNNTGNDAASRTDSSSRQDDNTKASDSRSDALSEAEAEINGAADTSGPSGQADKNSPETSTNMTGLVSSITMNFETDYQGFKELVDYVRDYPVQTIISSISVSRDNTTNRLTGTLVMKRFALTGTGKVYEAPKIDDINIGMDNIFGTSNAGNEAPAASEETGGTEEQEVTTQETP